MSLGDPEGIVSLLLDCHELAARLATDEPPVVLDVRWTLGGPSGAADFAKGHIPGAHFVDLDRELSAPPGRGRHPLPDAIAFGAAMRRHGVDRSRLVVAYDAATGTSAARAWWLLRYFGHGDAAVLDGGYAAWIAAGLPIASGDDHDPAPGDFEAHPGGMPLIDAEGALASAHEGVLIDARAPERFRGETEPVDPVAGHIPGARNVPAQLTQAPDGRFLTPSNSSAVCRGRRRAGPPRWPCIADQASSPPRQSSRWASRESRRRSTRDPGASGSPIPAGRSRWVRPARSRESRRENEADAPPNAGPPQKCSRPPTPC